MPHPAEAIHVRLMRYTQCQPNGCWLWVGFVTNTGYGALNIGNRMVLAHRASYVEAHGPIGEGIQLHHVCGNRRCVNPSHLHPVTLDEHNAEHEKQYWLNSTKECCLRGHPFDAANTYINPRGERQCRTCNNLRAAKWRERQRLSA